MHQVKVENVRLEYLKFTDQIYTFKEYVTKLFSWRRQKDLSKVSAFNALDGISFTLNEGDKLGVIGLNGAGKSTLLKVVCGILQPTEGKVEVRGNMQPLIEVGAGFNPEFTGRENIYLNGYMLGFSKPQIQEKEKDVIKFAGIDDFIDTPIKYYSSGMVARLAFAIATSIEPEILVFDEMISAGDISFIEKAKRRIGELLEKAKIMIIVSHDLSLIEDIVDRVIVLKDGRVVYDGETTGGIQYYKKEVAKVEG